MDLVVVGLIAAAALAPAAVWLLLRTKLALLQSRLAQAEEDLAQARQEAQERGRAAAGLEVELVRLRSDLDHERAAMVEKLALLDQAKAGLAEAFQALSAEALRCNNQAFLDLARTNLERFQVQAKGDLELRRQAVEGLVGPLKSSLEQVNAQLAELEKRRTSAYAGLSEQVRALSEGQKGLQAETARLVTALRRPQVRGRWGEIQLKRVVELAGMTVHCDFAEQSVIEAAEGGRLRPDLVVKLPGGKSVVVDAKAPLQAYLEAMEAQDETERQRKLKEHVQQIKVHIGQLSSKGYWSQFSQAPDFVVLFLPGESFFSAALEQDPGLIEEGTAKGVILATPTSLIALLKAVAYGWQQEKIAESAQKISQLGRDLYGRLAILAEHFNGVGKGLDKAVESYNKAVGSLEGRVLAAARRFNDLGVEADKDLPELTMVDKASRTVQAPELVNPLPGHGQD